MLGRIKSLKMGTTKSDVNISEEPAFAPDAAEVLNADKAGFVHTRLSLAQYSFAVAAMVVWRCSRFLAINSTKLNVKLTFRRAMHEIYCYELSRPNCELARRRRR